MKKCKIANGGNSDEISEPNKKTICNWVRKQKSLCLRKVTELEADRIRASTQMNIGSYFDIYERDIENYKYNKSLIVFF
jgi:hypothetical protein